jgi:NAD(P)-dependent dehydrogenase (short-subunit alcohol dehydrogenase family)
MSRMEGKRAVVTGGGRNIGRAIAGLLAAEGAEVWILDHDESGRRTAAAISDRGFRALFLVCDVTLPDEVERAAARIEKEGPADVLVNNVGGAKGITLEDVDEDVFDYNVAVNLKSAFYCTKALLPGMRRSGNGSVVFMSSVNATLGGFSQVAYASAKAGLHSLVRSLTADYARQGIRFNAICAGSVPGESRTWATREREHPGTLKRLASIYPLGRLGEPIDIAKAVLFLASDDAQWITGVVLPVDGGISASGALPGGRWWEQV